MKFTWTNIISGLLILAAVLSVGWWVTYDPVKEFVTTEPGLDNRGEGAAVNLNVNIGEYFERYGTSESNLTETWPRFRGENFDNISRSKVKLLNRFESGNPEIKWKVEMGEGHAGAAIFKGKVYVLDYDESSGADMLRCFSLVEGTELWRRWYKVHIKRNHGMSRTVPAVTDEYILTIGPRGHVMCVERNDGKFLWGLNIEAEYESEIPFWYTGQCPLIDNGLAIIATGGKSLIVAIDCSNGEIIWETPNPHGWNMSHSSIMPFTFGGVKMYVYSAVGGACGIMAEGSDAGSVLWETSAWNHQVVAPSPVCLPDGKIFLTAGYGAGSMVLQLRKNGKDFEVEIVDQYLPKEGLASEQQTPVVFQGHLFGILPKDAGPLRNQLVCVNPEDFKRITWSSGQTVRFGLGPYMLADGKLFILNDDGTLTMVKPDVNRYVQIDQARIMEGHDAWGPLAIADGYMVLRDSKTLLCIDLAESR
ncbi:MAG: PQQ-like beta-propeller repeat protein [Bacteroidales bacterium]|nr:PQQ-like beta-propeller repeat protein [Bacteroidales bacterium]HDS07519.1 hypothetical protein [Bacteroides sp.]